MDIIVCKDGFKNCIPFPFLAVAADIMITCLSGDLFCLK